MYVTGVYEQNHCGNNDVGHDACKKHKIKIWKFDCEIHLKMRFMSNII
jgi:hypothetical protein